MLVFDLIASLKSYQAAYPENEQFASTLIQNLQPLADKISQSGLLIPARNANPASQAESIEEIINLISEINLKIQPLRPPLPPLVQRVFGNQFFSQYPPFSFLKSNQVTGHQLYNEIEKELFSFRNDLIKLSEFLNKHRQHKFLKKYELNITDAFSQAYFETVHPGICAGMTLAYADWFKNGRLSGQAFSFSAEMVDHQTQLMQRETSDRKWHIKRLTTRKYLPNYLSQAEFMANEALKRPNENLYILSCDPVGDHACYLIYNTEGFHYMDPNIGAFQFDDKEAFCQFYQDLSESFPLLNPHSLEIGLITNEKPKTSWIMGPWRSLISGPKYKDSTLALDIGVRALIAMPLVLGVIGSAVAWLTTIGFSLVIPPLALPGIALIAAPLLIGGILSAAGIGLYKTCLKYNFHGIMAPFHLVDYAIRNAAAVPEQLLRKMSKTTNTNNQAQDVAFSSSQITKQLGGAGPSAGVFELDSSSDDTKQERSPLISTDGNESAPDYLELDAPKATRSSRT